MTRVFLYILGASQNPNNIECSVPFLVNNSEIFFGPCKKRLREKLNEEYLKISRSEYLLPKDDLYIVGANARNRERIRKIVWAGKIQRLMTFEAAFHHLSAKRYREMIRHRHSPLHVKPLYNKKNVFIGYEHRSNLHSKNDGWVVDLINSRHSPAVQHKGKRLLLLSRADKCQAFPRDCSFLLENIFFAQGHGVQITNEMVKLLKQVQPEIDKLDDYPIFGYRKHGSVEGLTGRWLEIMGAQGERFLSLIKSNLPVSRPLPKKSKRELKACNCR